MFLRAFGLYCKVVLVFLGIYITLTLDLLAPTTVGALINP